MRREAAFPQPDAHRRSLATYFPEPGALVAPGSGNGNVK
jgi:hypothetical protein